MDGNAASGGPAIGFLGLGQMGGPMVSNLVKAGYTVTAYDPVAGKLAALAAEGAVAAGSAAEAVKAGEVVMTSLRSSAKFVEVAASTLVPNAREGQTFIDLGTTEAPEARRVAEALALKGATFLDSPVSGPSAPGTLRIFVGGDRDEYERRRPIFEVIGDPARVVHCGPSGTGQAVKAANQLAMGLVNAAYMEAVAFGVLAGASVEAIMNGVGHPGSEGGSGFRARVAEFARKARDGEAEGVYVKFPELPYYLREADERGFEAPLTRALWDFTRHGPADRVDNMGRPVVSFWSQLMQGKRETAGG